MVASRVHKLIHVLKQSYLVCDFSEFSYFILIEFLSRHHHRWCIWIISRKFGGNKIYGMARYQLKLNALDMKSVITEHWTNVHKLRCLLSRCERINNFNFINRPLHRLKLISSRHTVRLIENKQNNDDDLNIKFNIDLRVFSFYFSNKSN